MLLRTTGRGYNYNCQDLLNDLKKLYEKGYLPSYFLTWTGDSSYYSFEESEVLVSDDLILTLDEMEPIWQLQ